MSSQRGSLNGSSSSSVGWKYDVFLNFQGEDTGKRFTDHLFAAMDRKGFKVFKGDKELERETPISMELVKTIEESRISIVVFSRRYASCTWCLNELAKIVECMKIRRQIVIPIFYDVEPSVPRHQKGVFEEAFAKHEEIFKENLQNVQMWRNALQEVANLKGFHLKDRHESEFIRAIVEEVSSKLGGSTSTFMNLKKLLVSCLDQLQAQAQTMRIQWGRSVISSSPFFFFLNFFPEGIR
ncbi:TMV resistance protein N-like [Mangifera indica]|uniref:TMV resistance protein N-like n=1 Tax=Mangifera indica TaxID=29780 RepID=UPI001CFAFC0E|nr:TMV resistance protein N-like [Mangifera indica]